jgi:pyruvate/2-oxoglutarate dehydrogenase complex dihydrolipoamide acyltransferase (E2) component
MTVSEMFELFLAGKQLPSLAANQARSLLDLARSKLLSLGIRATETGDLKRDLLEAHRQLTGGGVYASAGKGPLGKLTAADAERIMATHKRTGQPILQLLAQHMGHDLAPAPAAKATAPAPAAKATAPAPAPAPSSTRPPSANARELAAALIDEQDRRDAAAKVRTRAQLAAMTPREVGRFFKSGGKLTD